MSYERTEIIEWIEQARASGARQAQACKTMGMSAKTFQRWIKPDNQHDGRLEAKHEPKNKLTELERQRIIKVANESDYANLPPSKIVPKRADEGRYIASESTFYRVLKAENQRQHRQKSKPVRQVKKPRALTATGANQIYSWERAACPWGTLPTCHRQYAVCFTTFIWSWIFTVGK